VTKETWKPVVDLENGVEQIEEQAFLRQYVDYFAFSLYDLGVLKGHEVRINLTDDAPIYRKPYKRSEVEHKMIQAWTAELLGAGLVELVPLDCEYASATVMQSKKDIYGNWTEKRMCGDYRRINKFTKSDRYAMPTPEENFEAIGHAKVFSQGCHKGRNWRKITVRTSFSSGRPRTSSGRPRASTFTPRTQFYPRTGFYRPRTR
jgi:hypothetical protein